LECVIKEESKASGELETSPLVQHND
jgi:hypothetical protein